MGTGGHTLVAFIQDKLHINDISKYADVYNPLSDGGAFKNIKGFLDEHFSLELPHVTDTHKALSALRSTFPGIVHDVTAEDDLSKLDHDAKQSYLIIVHLRPVASAKNEEAAIAANDELVGKITNHLQKRSVRFTALYTAESSEVALQGGRLTRRLMQNAPDVDMKGQFFNESYGNGSLYAYLTSLSFCLYTTYNPDDPPKSCDIVFNALDLTTANIDQSSVINGGNSTLIFNMKLTGVQSNATGIEVDVALTMQFVHQFDRWTIGPAMLDLSSTTNTSYNARGVISPRRYDYDPVVSMLYSYHCTSMNFYAREYNNTPVIGWFTLGGFQVQPFNTPHSGFSLSQDCVGWFTTAIWMGLIPVALNILILFFGMYMISSLSTNDRFDDPKGKTLTINAGE